MRGRLNPAAPEHCRWVVRQVAEHGRVVGCALHRERAGLRAVMVFGAAHGVCAGVCGDVCHG
eukprot:352239-Chlamydomonas_euryale.AAC.4